MGFFEWTVIALLSIACVLIWTIGKVLADLYKLQAFWASKTLDMSRVDVELAMQDEDAAVVRFNEAG